MTAMKKGTKLTDTPKNFMLRARLDTETLEKLDKICDVENKSRSAVVREGIDEKYQRLKK